MNNNAMLRELKVPYITVQEMFVLPFLIGYNYFFILRLSTYWMSNVGNLTYGIVAH